MSTDLLLIDDSPTDLRVLMDLLQVRRLRFAVAFDGRQGFQQAQLLQPGLILLDVRMPGIDGLATCRLLKAHPATQTIPVIFLTAATDLQERLEGFAVGAVDYIAKPFHREEVLARIGVHWRPAQAPEKESEESAAVSRDAALVQAAQALLVKTLNHPPALDDLVRHLGTNRRRLGEAFQSCIGRSVFDWLREERLRQAHHLVCRTDTLLSQIGEHLGYASGANFTRAFRERYGFTPSDLRRDLRIARHRDEQG